LAVLDLLVAGAGLRERRCESVIRVMVFGEGGVGLEWKPNVCFVLERDRKTLFPFSHRLYILQTSTARRERIWPF
jgi:hypothetical protein